MKNIIKIVFIGIVIFGLVATYMDFGSLVANRQASFQEPTSEPSANGPTNLPTGQAGTPPVK